MTTPAAPADTTPAPAAALDSLTGGSDLLSKAQEVCPA